MTPNNPGQFSLADRYTSFAPEGVELMERCLNMVSLSGLMLRNCTHSDTFLKILDVDMCAPC
jgi:hypothetical protein